MNKFIFIIMVAFTSFTVEAQKLNVYLDYVIDGDTIAVKTHQGQKLRIRLMGIDAPEKSQPYGLNSKNTLKKCLTDNLTVLVNKKDRYGRSIAKVINSHNIDCNLNQIKVGSAWHYKKYANEQTKKDRLSYAYYEKKAKTAKEGLFSFDSKKPWEYRKTNR